MLLSSIKCDCPFVRHTLNVDVKGADTTFEDDYSYLPTGRKGYVNLGKNKVLVMEGWWRGFRWVTRG